MPLTPIQILDQVIRPALMAPYLPMAYDTREARVVLLAWALYVDDGVGAGLWGFDKRAILGVTLHPAVDDAAAEACRDAKIACAARDIARRIMVDHLLACRFARLALAKDNHTLPAADTVSEGHGWELYRRAIRAQDDEPEEDARARWAVAWGKALAVAAP